MPVEDLKAVEDFVLCTHAGDAPKNTMVKIKGGEIRLGKSKEHHLYGWDNEYGTYKESIDDFEASRYLVSNGEFMEFVRDGAYEKLEYWSDEGREFLEKSGVKYPHFWIKDGNDFKYRALYKLIDMPLNWPVDVNALEAEAFCVYKSKKEGKEYRLPSEAEYGALYQHSGLKDIPELHESRANINFYHYASSCPVDEFGFNGIYDVIGNVWQWSRTPIRGFKGFEVHPAYDDFSTPTFDEKHALILGASWASSGNLIMQHSRYAFRRHFFQNAGFRYVLSRNEDRIEDIYESDELVSQYCEFQYGATQFGVENFAVKCARIAGSFVKRKSKALDLGCATGRASFELAKEFDAVEGVDFSVRFVGVGSKLKNEGYVAFHLKEEGEITQERKVTLRELAYEDVALKVKFWQGDACNLKPNFHGYDLVMATNLIDRLYNPYLFLETIHKRINKDGILVLTSPYTWQEESTPKELWIGGYYDENGKEVRTFERLKEILSEHFEFVHREDVTFVIKETARKYQHTLSELSVWRRKSV
jgi:putative 4-mercaptohistidine N1-methyltranferase